MRIIDIINSEFTADKLKGEEELERVMNHKNLETNDKVVKMKELLREIAISELSFETFKKLTSPIDENKKITKNKNN